MAIEAKVPLVVKGVTKENTHDRSRGEFVGCCSGKVGVAFTTENA